MLTFLLATALFAATVTNVDGASLTGAEVIASVTSEQWDTASANKVVVTINDGPENFNFNPPDLNFTAGTAYILRVENNASSTAKHYYSAPELFATSAMRKIESHMAEVKADFLGDLELLVSTDGMMAPWAEYFFVPMAPGTYPVVCTIDDHEALGMKGTITVTDDNAISDTLVTDWSSDYKVDTKDAPDPRRSGDDPVWEDAETVQVEILSPSGDMTGYAFEPSNLELKVDQAYVLKIMHTGDGTDDKHYYSSPDFFKTVVMRKLEDHHAEFKFPYINAVELTDTAELAGKVTYIDLYLVPTVAGVYDVTCTIEGHAEAGMNGTITVTGDSDTGGTGGGGGDGSSASGGDASSAALVSTAPSYVAFLPFALFYYSFF